jgi:fructose-bisphosphate aldolase class 1
MTLRDTIINAVAGTVVLAAGGTIIGLKVNDAAQDERIARIEKLDDKMDKLSERLDGFNVALTRVETKQEGQGGPRQ